MAAGSGMPDHPGLAGAGLPASARVAIIGGGICRASALYHLAPEHAEPGTALEVRVVGDLRATRVLGKAVHDPTNTRLRA